MRLLTESECADWCTAKGVAPAHSDPAQYCLSSSLPDTPGQLLWLAKVVEDALWPREECLVWVTQSGIWPSSENLHLFDGWRKGYGDARLLDEAPGHRCMAYERHEVVTLAYLAMLFGWDVHFLCSPGFGQAFISHDEFLEAGFSSSEQLQSMSETLRSAGLRLGS